MLIFGTIIARIAAFMGWRWYDGRGYRLSEAIGWSFGALLGATTFGLDVWQQMAYGACVGLLATWCIVKGYNGWASYMPMLRRSWPAAGIPPVVAVAGLLGLDVSAFHAVAAPAMCVAANVTQVPLRRWQDRATGTLGKYSAEICEIYEAAWIGSAIVLMGIFHV